MDWFKQNNLYQSHMGHNKPVSHTTSRLVTASSSKPVLGSGSLPKAASEHSPMTTSAVVKVKRSPVGFVTVQSWELSVFLLQRSKPLELEMSKIKVYIIVSSFWRKP